VPEVAARQRLSAVSRRNRRAPGLPSLYECSVRL
jgi:hypothetical protein